MALTYTFTGHRCSSSRAELLAGILAAHADGPQHQGTDSYAYLHKLHKFLRWDNLTRRRPWSLPTDGDLWEYIQQIIEAKGRHALSASKVKGHATTKEVQQGLLTLTDKEGNDIADLMADDGVLAHGKEVVELSIVYAQRQKTHAQTGH